MVNGKIITAMPLSDTQLRSVVERFEKKLGQGVSFTQAVDPSLIGGVIVDIDGRLYDVSIKSQLAAILKTLQSGGTDTV